MLMTTEEEKRATVKRDDDFFKEGIPGMVSAVAQRTWAEPFMLARRIFGEGAETFFEGGARFIGKMAGRLSKAAFAATGNPTGHVLEDTLKATRIAENFTGIYGEDYYIGEKKIVRRIHTCPFRDRDGARILCHVGEAAGQELFEELVPGTRHKVHVTMARGHAFCEYSYEI